MAKREPFIFRDQTIEPGERLTVNMFLARLYTDTPLSMPVEIVHGRQPGPTLFVSAAIHGDEINGVEIIQRLLEQPALKRLKGTLLAIPVVNVFGFISHSRYLPDRRDLNRFFPGSERGSMASWIANLFMKEIVARSTHGIDLHTGSNHRTNLPQIRADLDHEPSVKLAEAFGAPVMIDSELRDGSLREAAKEAGVPVLLYEAGEALRIDERAVRIGLRGVLSAMRSIGMLPAARSRKTQAQSIRAKSTFWIRAPRSGFLRHPKSLGQVVRKGTLLGTIMDPLGDAPAEIHAPSSGIIIGATNMPLLFRGDAVFHIARPEGTLDEVDDTLEEIYFGLYPDRGDFV